MTKSPEKPAKSKKKPRKKQPKGLAVYTEGGAVPRWVTAARSVLVLGLAATIPFILGVEPGRRLLWAAAIPILPVFWVLGGYHLWRRLCPLAVLAQLGRLFGKPGPRRVNGKGWFGQNYMLVQTGIMVVALSLRLTMTNGTPEALAVFLVIVVLSAVITGVLFTGKTWCNYICPVGMVEKFYTEPARLSGPANSQCSPCTACKKNCPDIDLEQGYWKELMQPARHLAYFAWPGLVLAFYTYYYFVAGDWDYYFSGTWTLENTQLGEALSPGFFFLKAIPIAVAAPLTLLSFGAASAAIFAMLEKLALKRTEGTEADIQRIRHRALVTAGFVGFITFYFFGGQPSIRILPPWFGAGFSSLVTIAATAIFVRRWRRTESDFVQEKFAEKILSKWEWGDEPESGRLQDIYLLHHERKKERDSRLAAYKETVREMVADGLVTRNEMVLLDSLRAQLGVSDKDHERLIAQLGEEERQLFDPDYQGSVEQRVQMEQYQRELGSALVHAARTGEAPLAEDLEQIRLEHGVEPNEHARVLAELRGDSGPLLAMFRAELAATATLGAAIADANGTPNAAESTSVTLLGDLLRFRAGQRLRRGLGAFRHAHPNLDAAALAKKLRSANPSDRRAAIQQLEEELDSDTASRIREAAEQLWPSPADVPSSSSLVSLTTDSSPYVRAIAAHMLSRFNDDEARHAAAVAIDDDNGLVREAAAYALGVRGRMTKELMSKALKDPDRRVRSAAISSRSVKGQDPQQALERADVARSLGATGGGTSGAFATFNANASIESLTTLDKMALLKRIPLFAKLAPEDLEEASMLASERSFAPGDELCHQGEDGEEVFVIVSGRVEVWTGSADDKRVLGSPGAGSCIGEMSVLDAAPRSATVTASEATRSLVLPAEEFRNLIYSRPAVGQAVIDVLVSRLRQVIASGSP